MPLKLLTASLLLLIKLAEGLRRGPHHPRGQQPVPRAHHHPSPSAGSLTADVDVLRDVQHLDEDSPVLTPEMLAAMSPEELEFHYFTAHDFDRNTKLDGLELLKAVYHTADHEGEHSGNHTIEDNAIDLERYIEMVDRTLELDDADGDGYVSYAEYRAARRREPHDRTPHVLASPPEVIVT